MLAVSGYVGSSNLSQAALLDGLEWNVRLSSVGTPSLLHKFEVTFDSYWEQRAFQSYDPERDGEKLDAALECNGGRHAAVPGAATGLEVQPFLHQEEMLEDLEAERLKGFNRNLVVAATGTGKTVIAALDYKRLCEMAGRDLKLLFVAHRQEILQQAIRTYRDVMQDGAFGELYVGEHKPTQCKHIFASVQSLSALGVEQLEPGFFDAVVIDEFHHAMAPTYWRLMDHLLQQLGRGLRRAEGKAVLTVMDFIGQQHREFRFDLRYRALTGYGRTELKKAGEDEFPYLPSGSQIMLDRVAQEVVLANIKAQLRFNRAQLVTDIASYAETELEAYLKRSGNDMKSIYVPPGTRGQATFGRRD